MGFNDSAYQAGQATPSEDATLQRKAGSTLWRTPLDWGKSEPEPGRLDLATTDAIYCAAVAAGLRPVFDISNAPAWATDAPGSCPQSSCPYPPSRRHYSDLTRFAEKVAIRYPRSAAIEAWNEPNLHEFWASPDPARYVVVLRAIYRGVKNGNPATPVLGGALSDNQTDDPGTGDLSLSTFLRGMYEHGAARDMDALSIHPYPLYPLRDPRELFDPSMRRARALAARYDGRGVRHLWITEVGAPTAPVGPASGPALTPDQQAGTLLGIYRRADAATDVDAVMFHTLIDPNELIPGSPGFGWLVPADEAGDFSPKPTYCAFARLLARPLDCSTPLAPP
jgi:hypothetical protein